MPDLKININNLEEVKKSLENSEILILGVSYKPNVKDIQLSPAKIIIKKIPRSRCKSTCL